jgi:hypothetical protein
LCFKIVVCESSNRIGLKLDEGEVQRVLRNTKKRDGACHASPNLARALSGFSSGASSRLLVGSRLNSRSHRDTPSTSDLSIQNFDRRFHQIPALWILHLFQTPASRSYQAARASPRNRTTRRLQLSMLLQTAPAELSLHALHVETKHSCMIADSSTASFNSKPTHARLSPM